MNILLPRFFLLILCLLIASCSATGPAFTKANNANIDYFTLYIYRPSSMVALTRASSFSINGKKAAKLSNKGYTWFSLKPGKYEVSQEWFWLPGDPSFSPENLSINFSANAGESHYVGFYPSLGRGEPNRIKFVNTLKLLDETNALQEIKDCRFQRPNEEFLKNIIQLEQTQRVDGSS